MRFLCEYVYIRVIDCMKSMCVLRIGWVPWINKTCFFFPGFGIPILLETIEKVNSVQKVVFLFYFLNKITFLLIVNFSAFENQRTRNVLSLIWYRECLSISVSHYSSTLILILVCKVKSIYQGDKLLLFMD